MSSLAKGLQMRLGNQNEEHAPAEYGGVKGSVNCWRPRSGESCTHTLAPQWWQRSTSMFRRSTWWKLLSSVQGRGSYLVETTLAPVMMRPQPPLARSSK